MTIGKTRTIIRAEIDTQYEILSQMIEDIADRYQEEALRFEQYIDTGSKSLRQAYSRYWMNRQKELKDTFTRSNVDSVSIATNDDYVKKLLGLIKQRS